MLKDKKEDSPKMVIYSSSDEDSVDVTNKAARRQKRKRVLEFSGKSPNRIILVVTVSLQA